jgi:hypothetical protein
VEMAGVHEAPDTPHAHADAWASSPTRAPFRGVVTRSIARGWTVLSGAAPGGCAAEKGVTDLPHLPASVFDSPSTR